MVMPRVGVATSDCWTVIPLPPATIRARLGSERPVNPASPAANTAAINRFRYPMAHLTCFPYPLTSAHRKLYHRRGSGIVDLFNTLIMLPFVARRCRASFSACKPLGEARYAV